MKKIIIGLILLAFAVSTQAAYVGSVSGSVVSTVNSSSTTLTNSQVFTGTAEVVSQYSIITVFVDSDKDGTLSMQLSTDGTNWDRSKNIDVDQSISSGSVHTLEVVSKYFRCVYTNGASSQTHFRLQTIYHAMKSGFLTSSPDQRISRIDDAQLIRVSNDPILDISRGLYADKNSFHRFGHNTAVPNGSFADIWSYGPTDGTYNWMQAAATIRVKSGGNANDTSAGTGARTVQIVFLDANGDQQQEQLTLAGATASGATSVTASRFIRAWVDASGTFGVNNVGDVVFEETGGSAVVGEIKATYGQTEMSQYTIPAGYYGYLTRITVDVAAGSNKDADVIMWQRPNGLTWSAPYGAPRIVREWDGIQGESSIKFEHLPSFAPLTDIWFEAQGNGAVTEVDVDYDIILVKDKAPTEPQ